MQATTKSIASLVGLWVAFGLQPVLAEEFIDSIAPLLQRRCLSCHNDEARKGGFSLQRRDAAFADGYIDAGDAASSHFIDVVTPVDGVAAMPKDADPLTETERERLQKWIDAGAEWPAEVELEETVVSDFDWWSYQPLRKPVIPSSSGWADANPIDAFIAKQLSAEGLTPAPLADRRTLIRRVTFDLIGLPPTPEQVEAFVRDDDPRAYEKLVDRLLASKHYGERWARHWLDVVRYADTCGYDKDKLRPNAWPYRDYVVRSFNEDKPYARFVQEQVAGDVLFPKEPDGILGLGFLAAGPWDHIGHVEVPESKIDGKVARNLDRDDMVSGTMNAFCSLTVQCARCHSHKFDPITQEHYYGMQAIFAAIDRADRPYDLDPEVARRKALLQRELQRQRSDLAVLEKEIATASGPRLPELDKEIAELEPTLVGEKPTAFGYHSKLETSSEVTKWVEIDLGKTVPISEVRLHPCHDDYAGIGAGFGFPVRFRVEVSREENRWTPLYRQMAADFSNPGLLPLEIDGKGVAARRVRITVTKLAERKDDYFFALAEVQVLDDAGANQAAGARVSSLDSIEAAPRWGRANLVDTKWVTPANPQIAKRHAALFGERDALRRAAETPQRLARRRELRNRIADTERELTGLPSGKMVYAAATHFKPRGNFKPTEGEPRPVYLLHRGNVEEPRQLVSAGVIPLQADAPWQLGEELEEGERRAALARWLTSDENPLLWRSIVNRIWQYHFGEGLVKTPNDFGRMGAEPTHPDLLDWLATTFRDNGQSMKQLHRLMVTSRVYRQDSLYDEGNADIDVGNRFLWRMNRRRLSAEEIRDAILAVSGALDRSMGGPGYYLFELEKVEHSPHYEYHKFDPADPATHRRSIYRFIVRSQPNPWMSTLDCADSSQSTPRRSETLTALQALSLLNNRFNLEMAERFAERLRREAETLSQQVDRAFQLVVQRPPSAEEQRAMNAYAREHGLTNLCRFLFNLSEFLYLD